MDGDLYKTSQVSAIALKDSMQPDELERLLKTHGSALQMYARQWAECPEDCVQQAFIELATTRVTPQNPAAWLFKVVRNQAISQMRTQLRRRKRETKVALANRQMFQPSTGNQLDPEKLGQAIEGLEDVIREVVVARIWGQLNFEEIGELVGCSSSTAHRRYLDGLNHLRKKLGLTWLIKN